MKRKIVITGGAGFVGANLVRALLKKNQYEIHILSRKGGSLWRLENILSKINIHEDFLNDKKKLQILLNKIQPSVIYHLAIYGSYPSQQDTENMININIKGTLNLLEASKDINYGQFIVVGSSSEYGKKDQPMSENNVLEPNNFYAATKAAQTHLACIFALTHHKPITVCRLFNVYGPYEEKGRLVRSVIESALLSNPILLATGREARDFIYVDDVVNALILMTRRKPFAGQIFNIGTGIQTTIFQLAKEVIKLTGSKSVIKLNTYQGRSWDIYHWVADTTKTKRLLRWKAKHFLKSGLEETIAWYRQQINE